MTEEFQKVKEDREAYATMQEDLKTKEKES
jgi:hypothetical protein